MDARNFYREAAVRGASPVQLVVQLYDQILEDLRHVASAIEEKDIRRRTDRVRHALLVIGHLQSSLDFAQGGEIAKNLERFYNALRQNLVSLQFRPTKRAAQQLTTDVLAVRSSWVEVERIEGAKAAAARQTPASSPIVTQTERARIDWKG